jgi:hypothetical protein
MRCTRTESKRQYMSVGKPNLPRIVRWNDSDGMLVSSSVLACHLEISGQSLLNI